jgi:hypothetical protein
MRAGKFTEFSLVETKKANKLLASNNLFQDNCPLSQKQGITNDD